MMQGLNLLWLEQVGHELEQQGAGRQRAGNLRNAVRRLALKSSARAFASRAVFLPAHPQKL